MEKGVVVDLLDEKIRHVGARDEPACPAARIAQRAIGVRFPAANGCAKSSSRVIAQKNEKRLNLYSRPGK